MKTVAPERLAAQREVVRRKRAARARRAQIFKHAWLILASIGMLYPLLWMISSSFKPEYLIFSDLSILPREVVLDNYAKGWSALRTTFTTFYTNSFVIAALSVIGNLAACSLTA